MGRVFIYSGITFPFVIYYATEGDATLFVYIMIMRRHRRRRSEYINEDEWQFMRSGEVCEVYTHTRTHTAHFTRNGMVVECEAIVSVIIGVTVAIWLCLH